MLPSGPTSSLSRHVGRVSLVPTLSVCHMTQFLQHYQLQHLTGAQRRLLLVASLASLHYAIGTVGWLFFISLELRQISRTPDPAQFWSNFIFLMPFFLRIWKSILPLVVSLLAISFIPFRPRYSLWLTCLVLVFSVLCASYDISFEVHEISYFGRKSGLIYFTWWWYYLFDTVELVPSTQLTPINILQGSLWK